MDKVQAFEFDSAADKPGLIDPFGRAITYLRVSVTDRCDFRCVYCMAENMSFLPKAEILSLEELDRLCSAFVARGVRKLRLTGGEPAVHHRRDEIVGDRRALEGDPGQHRAVQEGVLLGADLDAGGLE